MGKAIEINGLKKRYGNFWALKDVNMSVEQGTIYGFLGKNGAGKTTTIRIILKHIRATEGSIRIFGMEDFQYKKQTGSLIGSIVEVPAAYQNLSGYENLLISAQLHGKERKNIAETLKKVGLSENLNRKVKKYSLGMKQRLGIAMAIIHSPKILILDEPTNGLDPKGIKEMRDLFKMLSREYGMTLLISSHILSEMQQTVDTVGIIDEGKMVGEYNVEELNSRGQEYLIVETDNAAKAMQILENLGRNFKQLNGNKIKVNCPKEDNIDINKILIQAGVGIYSSVSAGGNLEEVFLKLTEEESNVSEAVA